MALAEVARTKEKEVPAFTARVTLGGKALAGAPVRGALDRGEGDEGRDGGAARARASRCPSSSARDGKAGVLYYGALVRYAPAEMPKEPLERGIFVQRWFEPYEGGGQIRAARAGDLVRVRVRVGDGPGAALRGRGGADPRRARDRGHLARDDRAHGSGAARRGAGGGVRRRERGGLLRRLDERGAAGTRAAWGFRFWSPFVLEEKRDDRLVLFADELPPGLHVTSFVARATTPGEFVLVACPRRGDVRAGGVRAVRWRDVQDRGERDGRREVTDVAAR